MQRTKVYREEYKQIRKIRLIGLLLAGLFFLSGCTKKEELLLLSGETTAGEEAFEKDFSEEIGETVSAPSQEANGEDEPTQPESVSEPELLCVHVCGAVMRPGVYELPAGCRVYEAVREAGGFAENANQNYVNQAQTLRDGVKLVIPTKEEVEAFSADGDDSTRALAGIVDESAWEIETGESGTASDGRININTASEAELCNIPGIGGTRAAAIVTYRESNGSFQKPEDIMKVSGIKEGLYEKIKDSIRVD